MSGEQDRPDPGQQPGARPSAGAPRRLLDGPDTPRLAALDGLLRDLDGLRRTVETDLTLAAAAVDAEEPGLAASLVQGDREQLAAFEVRALQHLRALERADAEAPAPPAHVLPVPTRRRRRALRVARLLPAAPLVAAAAALVGLLGIPQTASRPAPPQVPGTVLSSWEELTRLSAADAPADEVQRAAMDLNADIASMVARSGDDPAAARQALALLREAQAVLAADDDAPALAAALTQARQLAARLLASLPPSARPSLVPPSALRPVAPVLPSPRGSQQARPQRAPRPDTASSSRPRRAQDPVAPRRRAEPEATPSRAAGAPPASPAPSPSPTTPSGRPTPTPPPVLPGPVTDPL